MSRFAGATSRGFEITYLEESELKSHYSTLLDNCFNDRRVLRDYHAIAVKDSRSVRNSLNEIIALDCHPAAEHLAWSRIDGSLSVLRSGTDADRSHEHVLIGSIKKDVHGEGKIVYSISWNPNELQFASVGNTPTVRIWNVLDDKLRVLKEFKTTYKAKNFITEYDPSGTHLAVVTKSNEIYVYDVNSGYDSYVSYVQDDESEDAVHSLCWSNDSKHIIVAYKSGFLKCYAVLKDELNLICQKRNDMKTISSLIMDPLGRSVIVGTHNSCSLWSLPDLQPLKNSIKSDHVITGVDVSFDGSMISIVSKAKESHDCFLDVYWFNDLSLLYTTPVKSASRSAVKWSKSALIFYTTGTLDRITMVDLRASRLKASKLSEEPKRNESVKSVPERPGRSDRDPRPRLNRDREPRQAAHRKDSDRFSEKSFGRFHGSKFRRGGDKW